MSIDALLDLFPKAPTHFPRSVTAGINTATGISTHSFSMRQSLDAISSLGTGTTMINDKSSISINGTASNTTVTGQNGNKKPGFAGLTRSRVGSLLQRGEKQQDGSAHSLQLQPSPQLSGSGSIGSPISSSSTAGGSGTLAPSTATTMTGNMRRSLLNMTGSARDRAGSSLSINDRDFLGLSKNNLTHGSSVLSVETDALEYTLSPGIPDRDYVDLFKRACRGAIAARDLDVLLKFMTSLSPHKLLTMQRAVHEVLMEQPGQKSKSISDTLRGHVTPMVEVSKYALDFGSKGRSLPLNQELTDTLTIEGRLGKIKYQILVPETSDSFELRCDPATMRMKSKDVQEVKFTLRLKTPTYVNELITIDIEGGNKHYCVMNVSAEWSPFGAKLDDTQLEYDVHEVYPGHKYRVPKQLIQLYNLLVDKKGFEVEEIFRKQASEDRLRLSRMHFLQNQFMDKLDPESISGLMKLFLREVPMGIINIPVKEIMESDTPDKSIQLITKLDEKRRHLIYWTMDVMCRVIQEKEKNRMSFKKVSIVMAPNVFSTISGTTQVELLRRQAEIFTAILEDRFKKIPA